MCALARKVSVSFEVQEQLAEAELWKKQSPIYLARMNLLTVKLIDPRHLVSRERKLVLSI